MLWLAAALAGPSGILHADTLAVSVRVEPRFSAGAPVVVEMAVHNPTDRRAVFCTYHTAFEGIWNRIFDVTQDGVELPYRGKMAKRAPPTPRDHRQIKPGQTVTASVDLREGYTLEPGTYRLRYRGTGISGLGNSAWVEFTID